MIRCTVLNIVLLMLINCVETDIFTSVSKMERLARLELGMFGALQKFIQDSDVRGIPVEEFIRQFEISFERQVEQIADSHYCENPINAFHLLKRVNENWERILSTINCDTCALTEPARDFQNQVWSLEESRRIFVNISSHDVEWAALGIVRLWQTYKLNLTALFRGQILDTITDPLSCEDILYICNKLDSHDAFYKEIIWLQQLLNDTLAGQSSCRSADANKISRVLAAAYAKYGMPWVSLHLIEQCLLSDPDDTKLTRDLAYYKTKLEDIHVADRNVQLKPNDDDAELAHYEALCRGEGKRSMKTLSRLRCIYRQTKVSYYTAKEEIINYSPRISIFHQVITDSEVEELKTVADNLLQTSMVVGEMAEKVFYSYRVSQTAWFGQQFSPLIKRLALRVQLITGLSTAEYPSFSHAEEFQVLNYGIGGMYQTHYDFFPSLLHLNPYREQDPPHMQGTGDRMATWMFYLSDVKAGGATVFTEVNVTIPVEKGAAAFWYNIKRNGDEADSRTTHAGCPVLLGSKWVANKWIRQHGQIFLRKCGKTYKSIDIPMPK